MSKTIIFLYEKFLQKKLLNTEKQLFAKLLRSKESEKELSAYQLAKSILSQNPDNEFRNILREIEYEYEYKSKFSADELQKMFAPSEKYEKSLNEKNKANKIYVVSPKNGTNSIHYLQLELNAIVPYQMVISIYSNKDEELLTLIIPSDIIYFDIPLKLSKSFLPGRYYWKLFTEKPSVGMFFIGKGLLEGEDQMNESADD
ncbi:MAG: hypothetical protein AB8B69_13420 [Chitinophagales bacterium]